METICSTPITTSFLIVTTSAPGKTKGEQHPASQPLTNFNKKSQVFRLAVLQPLAKGE